MNCIVVHKGSIKDLHWKDPDYAGKISKLDLFTELPIDQDNFNEILSTQLKIDSYNIKNPYVKTEVIGEDNYYVYEMLYIDLIQEKEYHQMDNVNELATLLNLNGEPVFSDAIIIKSHIPSLTDKMYIHNMTRNDIKNILYDRGYTKVVVWDEFWREDRVVDKMENYANRFFEEEKYQTIELSFLMHNVNIWYTFSDFGEQNLCGKLVKHKIDKCIVFTNQTNVIRGCITLDEVKKIIHLSNVLEDYKTPSEFTDEKLDENGRRIIYSKYKVLDYIYENKKSNV